MYEDVGDADLGEGERLALDAQNEVLHPQRKRLVVHDQLGRPTPLHHQPPRLVPIKLRDGREQIQKVSPVLVVEVRDEARVNEDDLGLVPFAVEAVEFGEPGDAVLRLGQGAQRVYDLD